MKKLMVALLGLVLLLSACGKKGSEVVVLEKNSPEYNLAKALAEKVPAMDPDSNKIVATANFFKISSGELVKLLKANLGSRTEQMAQLDESRLRDVLQQNLVQLTEKKLLYNAAQKANVKITDTQIDSALQMSYQRAGGKEKFEEMINGMGITMDHVYNEVRIGLSIEKYLKGVYEEKATVSEEEIQEAYQQDKTASVRHILFSTVGKSEEEKAEIRQKAENVLKMAKSGKNFANLAKKYTDDPGSKNTGGLYENFGRGQMVKPFEDASFNLPVGSISDLVETQYGYHIIKVEDRKKETKPLEEVRDQLEQQIKQKKIGDIYKAEIERMKEEAQLEVVDL
ncbi:MAG: peptidylprolyl isomerase [Calditrichia bacterium]